ncbi:supernatant protein factor, C-terminal domain-containing protein [Teratosphaeria nubilosa]|uniref:Supernatant protein factor, C-terminal domain-containing protein n=1 Tax=Teratosphaeria nubilosa TaxID=161662 RepID=A0A6G1LAV5_9PEZI|nr:supernatant protein factor, C-terminal domain-containing protein [Teratosphaeria nubilosa]
MILLLSLLAFVGLLADPTSATALTYKMAPNEKECFYLHIDRKDSKVAFYFAVSSGGSFDIDYKVMGPGRGEGQPPRTILEGAKERQGDFVFVAQELGEYSFCFDNSMSTVSDKMVDFDIMVEHDEPAEKKLPTKGGASSEQLSGVEELILRLSGQVSTITRQQKYFRTRENRNFSTVRSTEKRIFNFSLMESGLMVAMAGLQVFVVKMFFTGGRKGYV